MSIKKITIATLAGIALTGTASGVREYFHTPIKKGDNALKAVLPASKRISDANAITLAATQPTQPIVDGRVSQTFINRFNNAIQLQNGQFVIIKSKIPVNATSVELATLNQLVTTQNPQLQQALAQAPKSDVVQSGNSVVIGQTPQAAQQQARQNQLITTAVQHHNGGNYCHVYWWGLRIGISGSTLHAIGRNSGYSSLVGLLGFVPYPPVKVASLILSAVLPALGTAASNAPGGIVFNSTPGVLTFWGAGWQ
ncbi:MAG: hypothetical protein LBI43_07105 [Streptococcaceae bacterium]|jgi:hypothetical protein|nr:hypothetical protein [Streptococcaceae bacterium]